MNLIILTQFDLLLASLLLSVSAGISILLSLQLEKKLFIAGIRTIVQLSAIGLILNWLFSHKTLYFIVPILLFMTLIAAQTASGKHRSGYRGVFIDSLLAIMVSVWSVSALGLIVVLGVEPWYSPQYSIPMVGLILGNALTAVALSLDRYLAVLQDKRMLIDTYLSLGATAWEANKDCARQAISAGMLPTINSMAVVGLVSLPGMMTGQVLAGTPPEQAVKYQIITMFFIAAASSLSCLLMILLAFRRFFSRNHVFYVEKLLKKAG